MPERICEGSCDGPVNGIRNQAGPKAAIMPEGLPPNFRPYFDPELLARNKRERHESWLTSRAYIFLGAARRRAAKQNVPFTVPMEWIRDRLRTNVCEMTGIRFRGSGVIGMRCNRSPSLDRRVPALGYTPENCRMVLWCYNAAKGSGTDQDVVDMAEALLRRKADTDGSTSTERPVG